MKTIRVVFSRPMAAADGVEFAADGVTPTAFRLWRFGDNPTDKDPGPDRPCRFTLRSAELVRAAYEQRGMPLRIDYEHESLIPLNERKGPEVGIGAGKGRLAFRGTKDAPEPWIEGIEWTPRALAQIHAKERSEISPAVMVDKQTREITKIINVALCFEGATHNGVLLAAAREKRANMDELIQKCIEALQKGDFDEARRLCDEMESTDGGGMAAKAMRSMMAAKEAEAPPPASERKEPPVATRRALVSADVDMFSRERARLDQATREARDAAKRSDRATVQMMLTFARNEMPGAIDAVDEREHLDAADPKATERFIASLRRKATGGVLVAASRPGSTQEANPPRDAPKDDPLKDMTEADKLALAMFNRGKAKDKQVTAEEFMASKRHHSPRKGG